MIILLRYLRNDNYISHRKFLSRTTGKTLIRFFVGEDFGQCMGLVTTQLFDEFGYLLVCSGNSSRGWVDPILDLIHN